MYALHLYGNYCLSSQPNVLKNPPEHTLYEMVSEILESVITVETDMGSWRAPTSTDITSMAMNCTTVGSAKALLD